MDQSVTGRAMRSVFLSHSFAERDRQLVTRVESVIRSHGLVLVTGRIGAGGNLADDIKHKIDESDALVAVLTHHAPQSGRATNWVESEFTYARFTKMRAIGVYEEGIAPLGPDAGFEHVDYWHADPASAFVRLSETLGEWKRRAGRFLKVMVMPKRLADQLGRRADQVTCEYRLQTADGSESAWTPAHVRSQRDGVYVHLRVPEDVERVQIRLEGPPSVETVYSEIWPEMQFKRQS